MQRTCLDIASISRYLNSLAEIEDVLRVERHVQRCARCRDKLIQMKRYGEALFDDLVSHDAGVEKPCPSHIQLQHFLGGNLNERQMVRVQEHLLACMRCREQVAALALPDASGGSRVAADLFATRKPDLDLHVAAQGIRIAAGGELLDDSTLPTLLMRLDLNEFTSRVPAVTTARQLGFARQIGARFLRGRIELAGYEDFHLELQPCVDPEIEALQLWTRESSIRRFAANRRFRELLGPGHYFIGPSPFEAPWLAVSVEQDFLTARGLAECAYDACCRGHFHSALRWFDDAVQLAPETDSYRALFARVHQFACRFGLEDHDRPLRWRHRSRPRNLAADDAAGDPGPLGPDVESIARLVLALRRRVEQGNDERDPLAAARTVSRHKFRAEFIDLMRWIRLRMGPSHGSHPAPGVPR